MKILFDHCMPKPFRRHLPGYENKTAYQMGWDGLSNGMLLDAAEAEFDVILTVDQNIPNQQNLHGRSIALVVIVASSNKVETLLPFVPGILCLLPMVQAGQVYQVIS